jgi:hypothetical protein
MVYGHFINSNILLLINIMPIFEFVKESTR